MEDFTVVSNSKQRIGYPNLDMTADRIPEGFQINNIHAEDQIFISPLTHDRFFYKKIILYSKVLKIMTLVDSLVCVLFFIGGMSFLIFLIALPILGYCAARHFHKKLLFGYLLYLVIMIVTRIVLIILINLISYAIVQGIIILLEIFVFVISIKFYRKLNELNKIERKTLRIAGYAYVIPAARIQE